MNLHPARPATPRDIPDDAVAWPHLGLGEAVERMEADGWAVLATTLPEGDDVAAAVAAFLTASTAALYPAWLPDAVGVTEAAGAGAIAVRRVANRVAASTDLFGPFLEAIAVAALTYGRNATVAGYSVQTVVRECHKLVLRSYGRRAALVLALPEPLTERQELALLGLADLDAFAVRMVGPGAHLLRRVRIERPVSASPAAPSVPAYVTPLSGRPSPISDVEGRLEAYLARLPWAAHRRWNHTLAPGPLEPALRVDLLWESERCIVEIDGPEHAAAARYAADRRRDRVLQQMGYAVLRFTNEDVRADLERVAGEIAAYLAGARGRAGTMGKD